MSGEGLVREAYAASYRRLVVQMLALCGDQAEAEDAVQEAFVKATPEGTVKTRLVKGRTLLAGLLSDDEEATHA